MTTSERITLVFRYLKKKWLTEQYNSAYKRRIQLGIKSRYSFLFLEDEKTPHRRLVDRVGKDTSVCVCAYTRKKNKKSTSVVAVVQRMEVESSSWLKKPIECLLLLLLHHALSLFLFLSLFYLFFQLLKKKRQWK